MMNLRDKLIEEIYDKYFKHLSRQVFDLMIEYDCDFGIIKKLAFENTNDAHIHQSTSAIGFTSLIAAIGDYCNNVDGEACIIYESGDKYNFQEIEEGMNETNQSIQQYVYERLDTKEMLVLVKSLKSDKDCYRIDIAYMSLKDNEEEKELKPISVQDLKKLDEAIKLNKVGEAIEETLNHNASPKWPDKIAETLLEAIIVRNIQNKAYVEFPDRYSKVAKNIVKTVEIPYGNSIDKDYLGVQVHICTKLAFKSAISDSHTCVKYAGNLGSDDDSDLYDPEVNYTYSATDIYLNEVSPYFPVFYNSDCITSKDGIASSNINIYILRKSIVAEED